VQGLAGRQRRSAPGPCAGSWPAARTA